MQMLLFVLQALQTAGAAPHTPDSTKDVIQSIVSDVKTGDGISRMSELAKQLIDWGVQVSGRIVAAVIIFFVGRYVIKLINRLFDKLLTNRRVDPSVKSFLRSLVNALLLTLLIISVINKLGIETTSFAALLASFGVAIGMAMSGNLSNFVGGMLILMFKPYRVGDLIKTGDTLGRVKSIEIFHTVLKTYDGTLVYMSNGSMSTAVIKNFSREPTLRLTFKLGLEYGVDFGVAKALLLRIAAADDRVVHEPRPYVVLDELADSSVNVILRLWVKKEDYWDVNYSMNQTIYEEFNKAGIGFAFPQITVHRA